MAEALSIKQDEHYPEVTPGRSSVFAEKPSEPEDSTSSWTPHNMWKIHGAVLAFSVNLNFFGIILIRSGVKWAFHAHWIVQALSASGLLFGCFIGVSQSTSIFQVCNQLKISIK
jgi:hypothetical protein